ncbi:MAG: hypothetical protein WDN45_11005 [Caulobacteraceae bacterium]
MKGPGLHLWIAAALVGLTASGACAQGFDHSRFQRSTLAALSANLAASAAQQDAHRPHKFGDPLYDRQMPPWIVSATYTGAVRPLQPDELKFVRSSLDAVGLTWVKSLYAQALLFRSDGRNFWLPVQSPLIPYFKKELKAGETIDLYVVQPGGTRRTSGWEWLFFVEDFQKPATAG